MPSTGGSKLLQDSQTQARKGPLCSDLATLRSAIKNAPSLLRSTIVTNSAEVLVSARNAEDLELYFITGNTDDLLFIGAVYENFRISTKPRRAERNTAHVIVSEASTDYESFQKVVSTIKLRFGNAGKTRGMVTLFQGNVVAFEEDKCSFYVCKGLPTIPLIDGEEPTWDEMDACPAYAEFAAAYSAFISWWTPFLIEARTWKSANCYIIYISHNCHVLCESHDTFLQDVKAVICLNSISTNYHHDARFAHSPWVAHGNRVAYNELVKLARTHGFPIIHTDLSYSTDNTIQSLHHLPGWTEAWPRLLPNDLMGSMLASGLDQLYTSLIRVRAAIDDRHGSSCVRMAQALVSKSESAKVWQSQCLKESSYSSDACSMARAVALLPHIAAGYDCPVDALPGSLAGLMVNATSELDHKDLFAAPVKLHIADRHNHHGRDAQLWPGSVEFLLIDMGKSSAPIASLRRAWETFMSQVRTRNKIPDIPRSMAQGWKDFCVATRDTVVYLTKEEQKRAAGDAAARIKVKMDQGAFTAVCKRSL